MTRSLVIVTIFALVGSLAASSAAAAQGDLIVPAGITTTGYGEASAPADSARVEFLILSEDVFFGGPPLAPQVEATPGAMARDTVAPIVEALEGNDAVESVEVDIPLITELYSQSPLARIEVSVLDPDLEGLSSLVNDATQAAAGERLLVGYVGAQFETSDCATLERAAREAAVADARTRAGIQAELLEVTLGEVVAAADVDLSGLAALVYALPVEPASNCDPVAPASSAGQYSPGASLPRFDPTSDSGEIDVSRQLRVTFAIDASEATPAP